MSREIIEAVRVIEKEKGIEGEKALTLGAEEQIVTKGEVVQRREGYSHSGRGIGHDVSVSGA